MERGKAGDERDREREKERAAFYYKIQTSQRFLGHSQQPSILLGSIDPQTLAFKMILSNAVALLEGITIILQHR